MDRLAKIRFSDKIRYFDELVSSHFSLDESKNAWFESFKHTVDDLREIGELRNSLLHSDYLFDFIDINGSILRNKNGKGKAQEWMTPEKMSVYEKKLSDLAVKMNFIHVQLTHWSDEFQGTLNLGR